MDNEYMNDEVEIDLGELFKHIVKHLVPIILVTLVCGAVCFGVSEFVLKKTYSSSATVSILSNSTAIDYTSYLTGSEVLKTVSDKVGTDVSGLVSASQDSTNTYNYVVSATTNDPKLSSKIVNSVIQVFQSEMSDSLNLSSVTVANAATPNYTPVSPNVKKNTMMGFVGGFIVSFGIVVLRFLFDKHLRTASVAESFLGVEVLAEIPYKK